MTPLLGFQPADVRSLSATPEERLAWLEQSILFAWEAGALRDPTETDPQHETPDL